jgi:hypothetical protein
VTAYDTNFDRKNLDFDSGDPIPGAHVKAIYEELGQQPRGTSDSVRSRIDLLSNVLASKANLGHTHAGTEIVSGRINTEILGSGTAGSGTFLRGDGVWASVAASLPGIIVLDAGAAVPSGTPVGTIILRRAS